MGLSLTTLISLIIVAIAIVQLARRWIKSGQIQANSSAWPEIEATIQTVSLEPTNGRSHDLVPCAAFSYQVNGEYYSGRFALAVSGEEAEDVAKQIKDSKVSILYNPISPSEFLIPLEQLHGYDLKQPSNNIQGTFPIQ